jgi:hypothetical protein
LYKGEEALGRLWLSESLAHLQAPMGYPRGGCRAAGKPSAVQPPEHWPL